jgi:hypothetical protein
MNYKTLDFARRCLFAGFTLAVFHSPLAADQGTTAASFLKLGTGPRAIAMGETYAGVADDVNAIRYNAAGTAFITDKQVTLMHAVWFQDISFEHGAVAWPIEGIGTIGLELFFLNAGEFDKYSLGAGGTPVNEGTFTANSLVGALAYSRKIVPTISAGLAIKMISESIDSQSAGSIAVDVSGFWKTPVKGLDVGMNVSNLGPSLGFEEAFSLPINIRLGVAYKAFENAVIAMDYSQPIETDGILSLGGEYAYRDFLFVRGGYRFQGFVDRNSTYEGFGPGIASGLSLGAGFKAYSHYTFDYAYTPFGFLGTAHRFALTSKFG